MQSEVRQLTKASSNLIHAGLTSPWMPCWRWAAQSKELKSHGSSKQLWEGRLPAPSIVSFHKWFSRELPPRLLSSHFIREEMAIPKKLFYPPQTPPAAPSWLLMSFEDRRSQSRCILHMNLCIYFTWFVSALPNWISFLAYNFEAAVCPLQNKQGPWGRAGSPFPETQLYWGNCISCGFQHIVDVIREPSLLRHKCKEEKNSKNSKRTVYQHKFPG